MFAMNRRHFIGAAASTLFMPFAIPVAGAAVARPRLQADSLFYDERFPEACRLVHGLPGIGRPVPVRGDVTDIWNAGLDLACTRSPLVLHGVTTESFYFCLKVLLASETRVETSVARIGRDLFRWTIRSGVDGRLPA